VVVWWGPEEEVLPGCATARKTRKTVGRLVDEVAGPRRAGRVTVEAILPLGRVLHGEEERPVVGGPRHRARLVDPVGKQFPAPEVLHLERVLAETRHVGGVGEEVPVVADGMGAEGKERLALGERVEVQRDSLRRFQAALFPAEDRVLFSLLGTE
jgi:hypothetical protein